MNKLGFGFLRLPQITSLAAAADGRFLPAGKAYAAVGSSADSIRLKGEIDYDLVSALADRYLALGGNYFDTCYTYLDGKSEEALRRCVVERHPRDRIRIADKLPGYDCRSYDDCRRFFEEECERCGVGYFDVYMLHWLNRKHYRIAEETDQFRFLKEKKASGEARRIGFSYHDGAELLDEILTKHPEIDVVQLQINYVDWEASGIESRRCYETAVRHGKKVFVMEPVKGGYVASLPPEAEAILRAVHPELSPAVWALRFVQALPEVEIVLSGMNAMDQVEENMRGLEFSAENVGSGPAAEQPDAPAGEKNAAGPAPLTAEELRALGRVREILEQNAGVRCTGCRYCVTHCPQEIPIPDYFRMYNELLRYPDEDWKILPVYEQTARSASRASDCVACRSCEQHCPQHLKISDYMKKVAEAMEPSS